MALFDYDRDALKPSIISAHGLRREVQRKGASGGQQQRQEQKQNNMRILQNVTSNIYNYGSGGNANTTEIELRTDKFRNLNIDSGETLEILAKKGAGLLHGLEVVIDNPYGAVYLEIDGYKNTTDGIGETPAELLLNNRTTRVDGQFYVKSVATDGTFTMLYTPTKPEPYTEQLRIMVSNRIKPSRDVFGHSLNYTSRGGIPTPIKTDFMGGGSYVHTGLKEASLDTLASAMAKPIGSSVYSVDDTYNQAVFDSNSHLIGTGHPYQGQAGKPIFTLNAEFDGTTATVEFATVATTGEDASAVAGPALGSSGNFPGTPAAPSHQNVFIYKDTSKDVTEVATLNFDEATGILLNESNISADAQTTLTVDTVDATTKFDVGDVVLDNTGQKIGIVEAVTATLITLTANNIVAVDNDENLRRKSTSIPKVGDRIYFRNKGTVYFPGIVQNIFRYNRSGDTGTDGWTSETTAAYGDSTGAHCFQVSPGLRAAASVFTKTSTDSNETISMGVVTSNADNNPKLNVKGLFIKRQTVIGSET
tara:strand:+ start:892 stop:2493 length:1602 start_codon:yes stop_codon:yes gene_type:complete